jgi:hypothetical protein
MICSEQYFQVYSYCTAPLVECDSDISILAYILPYLRCDTMRTKKRNSGKKKAMCKLSNPFCFSSRRRWTSRVSGWLETI